MTASTHTPHHHLSQFGPDDRPSWIDDYNKDMRTIDTALTQGGSQAGPLFCTTRAKYPSNFTVSAEHPYIADFITNEGNIEVDYDTNTIPITKSGYYMVSGYVELFGAAPDSGSDRSLFLGIGKYSKSGGNENYVASDLTTIVSCMANMMPIDGDMQTCSISPVIVHLNQGEAITMTITKAGSATITGMSTTMYLTVESKTFDDAN